MKLLRKVGICSLAAFSCLALSSCSTIGKIQKAFEKEGYTWKQIEMEEPKEGEEKKESVIDGVYYTYKGLLDLGVVLEFNGKDAGEALKQAKEDSGVSDETVKKIIENYNGSPITNGNCIIMSASEATINIFKNA